MRRLPSPKTTSLPQSPHIPVDHSSIANEIWAVANLLRGDFKRLQYGRVILPFALLRRLECVIGSTKDNVLTDINAFSPDAREIFEHFRFEEFIAKLEGANLLYLVAGRFAAWDLSPDAISNYETNLAFEELIRKFA